jgi:lipopolysaccharide assembly outer membrane protein LptD (OstA)
MNVIKTIFAAYCRVFYGARIPYLLFLILLFAHPAALFTAFAQQPEPTRKIEITRYNSFEFNARISPDAQRVIGDVEFRHEGMTMTCDSAYMYSQSNTLDAFGHVHITNADTSVTIDGDYAKYTGNTKFAEIWDNVVLVDSNAVMKTQHLYYDLNTNIAYYLVGGEIVNGSNDMVSQLGYYHRSINMFYFKNDVVLNTPDYNIITDTLDYNVQTKLADFVGPTYIRNEKDTIYCERGWYNTNDTVALFRRNAWIKSGSTTVNGDTLFYESKTGNGRAFSNIVVVDTSNNIILKGNKGAFNRPSERAWLTDSALLIMAGKQDSLYLHADTLRSDVDTAGFKIIKAYNKVRFYSLDMQGKCDSLAISLQDSIIHMFALPVIWAQNNQMTAEHIEVETQNQKPKRMNLLNKGFIAQQDSGGFNQIKGKKIVGLFRADNELYRVNAFADGETVYYIYDGTDITGANRIKSTDVVILIENRKAQEVTHIGASEGATIPSNEFTEEELTLTGFTWQIELRPVDRNDIYEWKEAEPVEPATRKPIAPR